VKNKLTTDPVERGLLDQIQPIAMTLQAQALQILSHPITALSMIFYVITGAIAYGRLRDLAEVCAKFVDDELPEYRSQMTISQGGSLAAYKQTCVCIDNALKPRTPAPQPQPESGKLEMYEFDIGELSELDRLWPTSIEDYD